MKKIIFIHLYLILFLTSCFQRDVEVDSDIGLRAQDVVGVDVRTSLETKINPAHDSNRISRRNLKKELPKLVEQKDTPIVVFCEAGPRATHAKEIIEQMGYSNVINLKTWRQWNEFREQTKNGEGIELGQN